MTQTEKQIWKCTQTINYEKCEVVDGVHICVAHQIKSINDAVLAEREACAAKAEQVGQHKNHIGIAAAIRARGTT